MSAAPILEVEGLAKRFGGFTALADVTARFFSGSLASIIGPNGAGKSTFFNLISGSLAPSAGHIRFQGRDVNVKDVFEVVGRYAAGACPLSEVTAL